VDRHKKVKVAIIIGTRPEAIKMASVFWAMKEEPTFEPVLVSTGQHSDLLKETLLSLGLQADYELNVMTPAQTLSGSASKLITAITNTLIDVKPDFVLVQGDTTSAFIGALSAFYLGIEVGHVEAGLRTATIREPFPEEGHRRAISAFSSIDFCPTEESFARLMQEGKPSESIFMTGNTGIDTLRQISKKIENGSILPSEVVQKFSKSNKFVLITCHRRESFGQPLSKIMKSIRKIADQNPKINFIFPVHPNPNVLSVVEEALSNVANVFLLKPLRYVDLVYLLSNALFVVSDSGGLQEEAPALGKRIIVLRDVTERMEAVDAGYATLVGSDPEKIESALTRHIIESQSRDYLLAESDIFGDGFASKKIVEILAQ
jgi:UDP-N-acetylglucosamine 2-epimerase (non-hydrolysing)